MSNWLAKKLVTEGSPYTRGQISHGIEIFLLMLLNFVLLLLVSYLLNCFAEALVISVVYTLHRNFTGGVHFKSQAACFYIGNAMMIGAAFLVKHLSSTADLSSYLAICSIFLLAYLLNARYAPARHTYVEYDEQIIRKNRLIVTRFLIFGCVFANLLVYLSYSNWAYAYTTAVLLQSILLHPVAFRLVESVENTFFQRG
ncbi:MAG: accessory gene regulator B family protein [Brevibacillus sp.]|nr:accessory gene regulator B family protein [Brevibacillus sp.]